MRETSFLPPLRAAFGGGARTRARVVRVLRRALPLGLLLVTASGCDWFGSPTAISQQGERIRNLYIGASIASLVVGVFVWGLIGWAVVRYRRRSDELPPQVRYNLPVEILYTAVPFVIVGALFYYTAVDEIYIDKVSQHPNVTVQAVGFRWSWQFNYLSDSAPGHLVSVTGRPNQDPTLVLPEHRTVLIELTAADVIHEFWVPQLEFSRQNVPGRVNEFEITLTRTGTYLGHCAQLCGTYHDRMNFALKVVTPAQYQSFIAGMRRQAATEPATVDTETGAIAPGGQPEQAGVTGSGSAP